MSSDFTLLIKRMRPAKHLEATLLTHENIHAVAIWANAEVFEDSDGRLTLFLEDESYSVRAKVGQYLCWDGFGVRVCNPDTFNEMVL